MKISRKNPHLTFTSSQEKAMHRVHSILAAIPIVALTATVSAQPAPAPSATAGAGATATAGTNATPTATATASTSAQTPEPASAFFCGSNLTCLSAKDFFVNIAVKFGVDWAKGVREALDVLVDDPTLRADLDDLPTGAVKQMAYPGGVPMDRQAFDKYLADNQCTTTGTKAEDRKATPGCDTLAAKIAPKVDAAITASQAEEAVKQNARYLYDKAMGTGADPNDKLIGDQKIAMLHLAGLMLPFGEWQQAFGLVDDTGSLVGKDACFLRSGEEAKCGKITAADSSGVTIDGEKVGWDRMVSGGDTALAIGDIDLIQPNWGGGGGGTNNDGFHLRAGADFRTIFMEGSVTNVHVMSMGVGVGYTLPTFPITGEVIFGGRTSLNGGIAPHYTEHETMSERWTGYAGVGVGYRPKFTGWLGMHSMVLGYAHTNGGGGFDTELGLEFYPTSWLSIVTAAQGGYLVMDNEPYGDNPGSTLANPTPEGGHFGGTLQLVVGF